MELLAAFGAIILVNVLAWVTPGPNMLAVVNASLRHGRKHGIATGLGLAAAASIWSVLAVLGVALVFELLPGAVVAVKLIGAAYLFWLGVRALRSAMTSPGEPGPGPAASRGLSRSFRAGFFVSITNPKAALFFGSVMTAFIPANAPVWFLGSVVVLSGALGAGLHAITATAFSTSYAARAFSRARKQITALFGLAFMAMGGMVACAALRRR